VSATKQSKTMASETFNKRQKKKSRYRVSPNDATKPKKLLEVSGKEAPARASF
jgi:hypothetical protein